MFSISLHGKTHSIVFRFTTQFPRITKSAIFDEKNFILTANQQPLPLLQRCASAKQQLHQKESCSEISKRHVRWLPKMLRLKKTAFSLTNRGDDSCCFLQSHVKLFLEHCVLLFQVVVSLSRMSKT